VVASRKGTPSHGGRFHKKGRKAEKKGELSTKRQGGHTLKGWVSGWRGGEPGRLSMAEKYGSFSQCTVLSPERAKQKGSPGEGKTWLEVLREMCFIRITVETAALTGNHGRDSGEGSEGAV